MKWTYIKMLFMACCIAYIPQMAIASEAIVDTTTETASAVAKPKKKVLVFTSVSMFAEGGIWWQEKSVTDPPSEYYIPYCTVGGALSIYPETSHQARLYIGYEYAPIIKSSQWGRIDSHWFTVDLNYKYCGLVFGAKCQILLDAKQQGIMPHEIAGLRPDCLNKVACNGYIGVSYYNVEVAMGFYFVPILNKKQVAINTLSTRRFLSPFSFSMRFTIPIFTTGKRKELFEIF